VIANYSSETVQVDLPEEIVGSKWTRRLHNKGNVTPSLEAHRALLPWEVEIYELAR
jgi:hypothetical protein